MPHVWPQKLCLPILLSPFLPPHLQEAHENVLFLCWLSNRIVSLLAWRVKEVFNVCLKTSLAHQNMGEYHSLSIKQTWQHETIVSCGNWAREGSILESGSKLPVCEVIPHLSSWFVCNTEPLIITEAGIPPREGMGYPILSSETNGEGI